VLPGNLDILEWPLDTDIAAEPSAFYSSLDGRHLRRVTIVRSIAPQSRL
jgi:hypothetical protein